MANLHERDGNNASCLNQRNFVFVFDIDGTLCRKPWTSKEEEIEMRKILHPECYVFKYKSDDYFFLPYLGLLFDYLIEMGARIVFFSSAEENRNNELITCMSENFFGQKRYELLKSKGQFDIFSCQHLSKGKRECGEGNRVKDMSIVIKNDETLLDTILIEDQPSYAKQDQKPCLKTMDVDNWRLSEESGEINCYSKNSTYYLLGIFKTYFEESEYFQLTLRKGIESILMKESENQLKSENFRTQEHKELIILGLNKVRQRYPEAIYYGYKRFDLRNIAPHSKEQIENILDYILCHLTAIKAPTIKVFLNYLEDYRKVVQFEVVEQKLVQVKAMVDNN